MFKQNEESEWTRFSRALQAKPAQPAQPSEHEHEDEDEEPTPAGATATDRDRADTADDARTEAYASPATTYEREEPTREESGYRASDAASSDEPSYAEPSRDERGYAEEGTPAYGSPSAATPDARATDAHATDSFAATESAQDDSAAAAYTPAEPSPAAPDVYVPGYVPAYSPTSGGALAPEASLTGANSAEAWASDAERDADVAPLPAAAADDAADPADTVLGEGARFEGTIRSDRSIRVLGFVSGEIESKERVVVESSARVEARIVAQQVLVIGEVHGRIECVGRVEIAPTGRVTGEVTTGRLAIREGAFFQGQLTMVPKEDGSTDDAHEAAESYGEHRPDDR